MDIKNSLPSSSASLGYETSKSPKYVPRSSSNLGVSPAYSPTANFNLSDSPAAIATGNTGSVVLSPAVSGASYSPSGSGAGGALSSAHANLVSPAYNPLLSPAYNPLSSTSPVYGGHRSPGNKNYFKFLFQLTIHKFSLQSYSFNLSKRIKYVSWLLSYCVRRVRFQ